MAASCSVKSSETDSISAVEVYTKKKYIQNPSFSLQQTSKLVPQLLVQKSFLKKKRKEKTTEKAAQKPPQAKRITEPPRLQSTKKNGRKECSKARSMFFF